MPMVQVAVVRLIVHHTVTHFPGPLSTCGHCTADMHSAVVCINCTLDTAMAEGFKEHPD